MATTDVEILQVNTQPAVKSLAELKKEFKEAKAAINAMDEGTEEFNKAALDASTRMNDLNEKMRLLSKSNLDFGTVVGNTSQALAGMSGLVQTVTGTLSLMGVEIGDDTKLMKLLVSSMSITQGLSAIDSGIKAVKALGIAIKGAAAQQKLFNMVASKSPYLIAGAAIVFAITKIIEETKKLRKVTKQSNEDEKQELDDLIARYDELAKKKADAQKEFYSQEYKIFQMDDKELSEYIAKQKELVKEQGSLWSALWSDYINLGRESGAQVKNYVDMMKQAGNTSKSFFNELVQNDNQISDTYRLNSKEFIKLRSELYEYAMRALAAEEDYSKELKYQQVAEERLASGQAKRHKATVKSIKDIKNAVDYKDYYDAVNKYYSLLNEMSEMEGEGANAYDEEIKKNLKAYIEAQRELKDFLEGELNKVLAATGKTVDDITYSVNEGSKTVEAIPESVAKIFLEYKKADNVLQSLLNEEKEMEKAEEERLRNLQLANIERKHEMDMSDNTVKDLEAQIRLLRVEGMIMDENNKKNKKKSVLNPNPTNTFGGIKQEEENQLLLAESKFNITQAGLDREYEAQKTYYQSLSDLYKDDQAKQLEISNTLRELDVQYEKDTLENHQELEKRKVEISQQATEQQIALINMYVDAYQTMSGAISGIIGSIADTQEQGTKEWKNLKTAEAIINTIAGGVGAFMSGVNSGLTPPFNIVLGAALAASTLAAGFAEVKKIQETKVSKNNSSSSVRQATVQTINNNPSNVRTTNPQWNDEGQIENNITETNTTVTLVTSDLEALNSQNVNIKSNNSF